MNSSQGEQDRSTNSSQSEHGLSLSNPRKKDAIIRNISQKNKNIITILTGEGVRNIEWLQTTLYF